MLKYEDCPIADTDEYVVGFLYAVVLRLPSSSGVIIISRKGMDPSFLLFFTCKLNVFIY